mmetsp:Transcript_18288/g.54069  ORF Transcript_18288/g.54069 Transcript_18288/m.54069 type:complete len:256 (-) Transcript_18288:19-786(-)
MNTWRGTDKEREREHVRQRKDTAQTHTPHTHHTASAHTQTWTTTDMDMHTEKSSAAQVTQTPTRCRRWRARTQLWHHPAPHRAPASGIRSCVACGGKRPDRTLCRNRVAAMAGTCCPPAGPGAGHARVVPAPHACGAKDGLRRRHALPRRERPSGLERPEEPRQAYPKPSSARSGHASRSGRQVRSRRSHIRGARRSQSCAQDTPAGASPVSLGGCGLGTSCRCSAASRCSAHRRHECRRRRARVATTALRSLTR